MSPRSSGSGWTGSFPEHRPRRPGPGAPRPGRRPFGATWWGAAWVEALEGRAKLDPNRLPRGRTYARTGAVGTLQLAPGEIRAEVQGSRARPYEVRIRIRRFEDAEWGRLLDALAAEIGHTGALLDGELPPEVAADVAQAGLDLLPGPGELQPRCSCPDWADPCKHAAAVCYLVADALDTDPFGVLLLRGLDREAVFSGLRARRRPAASAVSLGDRQEGDDDGVLAREAWARPARSAGASPGAVETRATSGLPAGIRPVLPRHPGRPTVLAADPPPGSGLDAGALRSLAADAAARALALARGARETGLELDQGEDLARRAARALEQGGDPGAPDLATLARRAGCAPRDLLCRALAYREWGAGGLAVLEDAFDPDPAAVGAGKALLGPGAVARRNRVTSGARQVRLGRNGAWYALRKERSGQWLPDGPPLELETGFSPDGSDGSDGGVGDLADGG